MSKKQCSVEGCEGASRARGMCTTHYYRWHNGTEAARASWKKYQASDKGREVRRQFNKSPERIRRERQRVAEYMKKNPDKARCWRLFRYAVKVGRIQRQPCEVCRTDKTEAHHSDYTKPYDVRWLCRIHHIQVHKQLQATH